MADLRWFAPNAYCALPVPALRAAGLSISLEGNQPARLAVAADGQCAVPAYEFARRHRCPLLLYLWDLPPWRLEGGKPDTVFELAGRIRRIPRMGARYPDRPGYYSRVRFVAQRAAQVWCPSENTARDVAARFGINPERVPFCYDSDRFNRRESHASRITDHGPLLSISRLVPHKNHAVLLRAAARLREKPMVRIIGQGEEAGNLRRLADQLRVRLELTDAWASNEEIDAAYQKASVVVAPSRFEGFGLTPMEGLALGAPVVASDIPPHREFVGGAVRFFPPDDPEALAREIELALRDPPVLSSSRLPVLSALTVEACAARFLPRLQRLLQGPR